MQGSERGQALQMPLSEISLAHLAKSRHQRLRVESVSDPISHRLDKRGPSLGFWKLAKYQPSSGLRGHLRLPQLCRGQFLKK